MAVPPAPPTSAPDRYADASAAYRAARLDRYAAAYRERYGRLPSAAARRALAATPA